MKSKVVKDIKKGIKLKIITISLVIFMVPLLLISLFSLVFLKFNTGDPVEMMKMFDIPYEYLLMTYDEVEAHNRAVDSLQNKERDKEDRLKRVDFIDVLVYSVSESKLDKELLNYKMLKLAMKKDEEKEKMDKFEDYLHDIYSQYLEDIKIGPIPEGIVSGSGESQSESIVEYSSYDDFGVSRTYGGARKHTGNDLMATLGVPLVSITDGEVTQMGWNDYGGWRIGITSDSGAYFYYAHLDRYEKGLQVGDKIKAGAIIGYIGDSGYGPPGTIGKFAPHLHLQIGISLEDNEDEYTWVNPYNVVKFLDRDRIMVKKLYFDNEVFYRPIIPEED